MGSVGIGSKAELPACCLKFIIYSQQPFIRYILNYLRETGCRLFTPGRGNGIVLRISDSSNNVIPDETPIAQVENDQLELHSHEQDCCRKTYGISKEQCFVMGNEVEEVVRKELERLISQVESEELSDDLDSSWNFNSEELEAVNETEMDYENSKVCQLVINQMLDYLDANMSEEDNDIVKTSSQCDSIENDQFEQVVTQEVLNNHDDLVEPHLPGDKQGLEMVDTEQQQSVEDKTVNDNNEENDAVDGETNVTSSTVSRYNSFEDTEGSCLKRSNSFYTMESSDQGSLTKLTKLHRETYEIPNQTCQELQQTNDVCEVNRELVEDPNVPQQSTSTDEIPQGQSTTTTLNSNDQNVLSSSSLSLTPRVTSASSTSILNEKSSTCLTDEKDNKSSENCKTVTVLHLSAEPKVLERGDLIPREFDVKEDFTQKDLNVSQVSEVTRGSGILDNLNVESSCDWGPSKSTAVKPKSPLYNPSISNDNIMGIPGYKSHTVTRKGDISILTMNFKFPVKIEKVKHNSDTEFKSQLTRPLKRPYSKCPTTNGSVTQSKRKCSEKIAPYDLRSFCR